MSHNHEEDPVDLSEKGPRSVQQSHTGSINSLSPSEERPNSTLAITPSQLSHAHNAIQHYSSYVEIPDEVYDVLSSRRKTIIVALLSFCGFLAPISSTTILSAVPEVASEYNSTGAIINLSNALYLVFMGLSPCFWGPLSQVYGRRIVRYFFLLLYNK
jgi:hypothetical protein